LVRLADRGRYFADWVLQRDKWCRRVEKCLHKRESFGLLFLFSGPPPGTGPGQKLAGRVRDNQIPILIEKLPDITLQMRAGFLTGENIAAPSIVAGCYESIAYDA
jgi:hypothetical protein